MKNDEDRALMRGRSPSCCARCTLRYSEGHAWFVMVEEAGFGVIEAGNADDTDIEMLAGSMNGLRLAAAVKRR